MIDYTTKQECSTMERIVVVWVLFLMSGVQATCSKYNATTQEMKRLFDTNRYDRRLRPLFQKDKVTVTVGMSVVHFGQIREVDMDYNIDIFFYQNWKDERLKHNLKFPIVLGGEYRHLIWMPDTFFLNIKTAKFHSIPADNSRISINPNGHVNYSTRLTLTAGCEMNLRDYPLDEQTCNLTILSYAFTVHDLDYKWSGKTEDAIVILNNAMNEFDLSDYKTFKEFYDYVSGRWTHLTASFSFKRRLGYSLIQVYAPTFLIVALSWLSFWISKDAVPARIGLGITTVLTIVTLMGSFRAQVPKVSYIKAIDLFFIVSFMFVFGAVLEYIAVILHSSMLEKQTERKKEKEKQEDGYDNNVISLNIMNANHNNDEIVEDEPSQSTITNVGEANANSNITNHDTRPRKRKSRPRKFKKAGQFVRFVFVEQNADSIDKVSRILFPVGYILFGAAYWIYYSLAPFHNNENVKFSM
ncbi:glycine receptor subunit alpha-1 isoform X2 [Exaiptasia diaphana]|nr:glycine receptor subunit alpha-1 isoform X2 [Exaiptasia diaphana]XP_020903216.1 glycine receptor subunit alpha-1 isoform X2 [Exaiptasia diaphana]